MQKQQWQRRWQPCKTGTQWFIDTHLTAAARSTVVSAVHWAGRNKEWGNHSVPARHERTINIIHVIVMSLTFKWSLLIFCKDKAEVIRIISAKMIFFFSNALTKQCINYSLFSAKTVVLIWLGNPTPQRLISPVHQQQSEAALSSHWLPRPEIETCKIDTTAFF